MDHPPALPRTIPFALLCCLLLGALAYANTLSVPFYLDDFRHIADNPQFRKPDFSWSGLIKASLNSPSANRPVANVSLAVNFLIHGERVAGYHLVNIAIHLLTGCLFFLLAADTLQLPALRARYQQPYAIALAGALIWLVHPLQTQSVTYIIQRMNSLAALFSILCLWLYGRGRAQIELRRQIPWLIASFLAFLLALGSKEIAAMLPCLVIIYEWFFIRDLARKNLKSLLLPGLTALALLVLLGFWFLGAAPLATLETRYAFRDFTMVERLLTEPRVLFYYLGLFGLPLPGRLSLEHDFLLSTSLLNPPTTVLAIAGLLGLLALACLSAKKERLLSFTILWFLGNLLIESSVIGLEILFEHRLYLPSLFLCLSVAAYGDRLLGSERLKLALLATLLVLFTFWTIERNRQWQDPVAFWADTTAKAPLCARAYNNLAVELENRKRLPEAARAVNQALRLKPDFVNGYVTLGNIHAATGRYDLAANAFQTALNLAPDYAPVYVNLGNARAATGNFEAAITAYQEALRRKPEILAARVNLATAMATLGRLEPAILEYKQALTIDNQNADLFFNLGITYEKVGQPEKAREAFGQALRLRPDDQAARQKLQSLDFRNIQQ